MMSDPEKKKRTSKAANDLYLADWSEQMAQVLNAGLTVEDGLAFLADDAEAGSPEKKRLESMLADVQQQGDLSVAMEHAGGFPKEMIQMVSLGEKTGNLEQILHFLKNRYERQDALKKSVWSAVLYPLGISLVILAMICIILIFVMPVFQRAYAALGIEMTGMSLAFSHIGNWLSGIGLPILIAVLAVVFVVLLVQVVKSRREGSIPFGKVLQGQNSFESCQFAGTMALCFAGGMTAEEGLDMADELNDSPAFGEKIKKCREQMDKGALFSDAVKESGIFGGREVRRIRVAEKTAEMDSVMQEIADDLQISIDEDTDRRAGRVEPVLMIVLTVIVALILLSVMLPLLGIMSTL